MVPRRSRFELYVAVLTEIGRGVCLPTRIMYGANMNWKPLKKTLETLKDKGFIEEQQREVNKKSKRIYTLTEKGDKVLKYLKKVNKILDPEITELLL